MTAISVRPPVLIQFPTRPADTDGGVQLQAGPSKSGISKGLGVLAGVGLGVSMMGGGLMANRLGAAKIGGALVAGGALVGAAMLLSACGIGGKQPNEFIVNFATSPDLTNVPPHEVYNTLRAHHEANAPAVEAELGVMKEEGKVRSFSGIIGANGFVIDVDKKHEPEVLQRLKALPQVGTVNEASLQ